MGCDVPMNERPAGDLLDDCGQLRVPVVFPPKRDEPATREWKMPSELRREMKLAQMSSIWPARAADDAGDR